MSKQSFATQLLALSIEKSRLDIARQEWVWRLLLEGEEHVCLCGRKVRDEVCLIENALTGARARIGACCAEELMGWPAKKIFSGFKRVERNTGKAFNEAFVEFACATGVMTPWEGGFYRNTWRLRSLTPDQEIKRRQINAKAVREVLSRRTPVGPARKPAKTHRIGESEGLASRLLPPAARPAPTDQFEP